MLDGWYRDVRAPWRFGVFFDEWAMMFAQYQALQAGCRLQVQSRIALVKQRVSRVCRFYAPKVSFSPNSEEVSHPQGDKTFTLHNTGVHGTDSWINSEAHLDMWRSGCPAGQDQRRLSSIFRERRYRRVLCDAVC